MMFMRQKSVVEYKRRGLSQKVIEKWTLREAPSFMFEKQKKPILW
jgi:hypothetical protein